MILTQSTDAVTGSFYEIWYTIASFLPAVLLAVIIFIIGWIVGIVLYRVIVEIARVIRIDTAMRASGLTDVVRSAGFTLDVGRLLGTLVMWFVVLVFLVASLEVLGLGRVTIFLQTVVLLYLPNVFVAALILILGAIVAEAVRNIIVSSARAAGAHGANLAATVAKWAIWVTAILAALNQLGVASEFVQTLFTGIVVAASLAFGLAFGLGGKEAAARAIEHVRSEISHKQ